MERFLFKKVELWVLGLVLVVGFLGTILFGAIVLDEERGNEELGSDHFGPVGDIALTLAETPETARQVLKDLGQEDLTMAANLPLPTEMDGGWSWIQPPGSDGLNGFLLLSRYDGDNARHIIEMVSLTTGKTVRTWAPDVDALLSGAARRPEFSQMADFTHWSNEYFRFVHPYLTETGEMLLKDHQSPLFGLSACGDLLWTQDEHLFHHSTQSDGEGEFWIPSRNLRSWPEGLSQRFVRDAIARVNAKGEVTFKKSVVDIFYDNDLRHLMFPASDFYADPIHLNDIEPVLSDGPYWQKGDLFLSFRNPSLIALYRPSTDKIIWSQAGPWLSQHDVDILDDHRIAIFSNNAFDSGLGARVDGVSETLIYDFDTGTVESPFREVLVEFRAATISEGLQDFTPTGHLIFEETNRGRVFIFDANADVVATFVNEAANGHIYLTGWSRYISQAHGEKALAAFAKSGCAAEPATELSASRQETK